MKKVFMVFILISLVLGGCAQNNQTSGEVNSKGASDFPKKTIELIVPYEPGGTTDTVARAIGSVMNKYLPDEQTIVIVNKPGGAGTIGLTELLNAKPDGYTIGLTTTGITSIQPHYGKSTFTHDSFQPIVRILSVPQIFVVQSDAPWKTFEEWLDYVKQNPGEFKYGTAGVGHTAHITMEALNSASGIETQNVPFDGSGPSITALLGGHVHGAVMQSGEALPQIKSGEFRALVNVGKNKIESYKDTPLLTEKGIDVGVNTYTGLIAPKGLPKDVQEILHDAFKKALEDPSVIEQFEKIGVEPAYAGPDEFQKDITDTFNENGEILKKVGLIE